MCKCQGSSELTTELTRLLSNSWVSHSNRPVAQASDSRRSSSRLLLNNPWPVKRTAVVMAIAIIRLHSTTTSSSTSPSTWVIKMAPRSRQWMQAQSSSWSQRLTEACYSKRRKKVAPKIPFFKALTASIAEIMLQKSRKVQLRLKLRAIRGKIRTPLRSIKDTKTKG